MEIPKRNRTLCRDLNGCGDNRGRWRKPQQSPCPKKLATPRIAFFSQGTSAITIILTRKTSTGSITRKTWMILQAMLCTPHCKVRNSLWLTGLVPTIYSNKSQPRSYSSHKHLTPFVVTYAKILKRGGTQVWLQWRGTNNPESLNVP